MVSYVSGVVQVWKGSALRMKSSGTPPLIVFVSMARALSLLPWKTQLLIHIRPSTCRATWTRVTMYTVVFPAHVKAVQSQQREPRQLQRTHHLHPLSVNRVLADVGKESHVQQKHRAAVRSAPLDGGVHGDVQGVEEEAGGAEGGVQEVLPHQDRARPRRHRLREAERLWGCAITRSLQRPRVHTCATCCIHDVRVWFLAP